MGQALTALLGAAVTVLGCYAFGAMLIDRTGAVLYRGERAPLAFILGAAILHLAIFAIMALKIAWWPVLVAVPLAAIGVASGPAIRGRCRAFGWASLIRYTRAGRTEARPQAEGDAPRSGKELAPLSLPLKMFSAALFGAFTWLYFFHAWAPESSPDGSSYHLGLVARYLRAHGFERITTDIYAMFGGGLEMLFVPAFAIGRHSAAALVHFAFAIALAWAMFAYARRLGKPWVGAAGAFLTFASPVVGIDASSAYNDVALAAVVFAVFYWLQLWDEDQRNALLIPVGLLAGYAFAVKYTAFAITPFALGFVVWRSISMRKPLWRGVALVACGAAIMAGPWLMKNWIYVSNPVAPFANRIFRNPYVHPIFEQDWSDAMRSYQVEKMRELPLEVMVRGDKTQGVIGPAFLIVTIALLALREQAGRRLLAAGAVLLGVYFANIGTRFLIPALPFFSLAIAISLNRPALLGALMLFHAVTSWPVELKHYAGHAWRLDRVLYKQALRMIPQDRYLRENFPPYGAARMIESVVPAGERVFSTTGIPQAYTSHEILTGFESAFGQLLADCLQQGWNEAVQPRLRFDATFTEQPARKLRVISRVSGAAQWSVHELRFYDRGVEIARSPEWRLRAWPNPWDAQFAFDNSEATRWRTGEPLRSGMYLEVDFGREQRIDEVRLESSADSARADPRIQIEESGQSRDVTAQVAMRNIEPADALRDAATYELAAKGVHYLVTGEHDPGADRFRDDPESWHLEQIAAGYGVRVYRITW